MSNVEGGTRVAAAIGVIKWVLIGLAVVVAVSSALGIALEDNSASYAVTVALATMAATAVWCLLVWVVFGWFEHSLLALVAIARNTSAKTPGDVPTHPASR
ncbi:hypothetical protein AB0H36_41640 [Kribbella sp. NPDC050820]|uniref:hypothetical protein n=1 Tax=Kribbella sp. NPDC050820 TaxID=3155408 RepID=UPI00340886B2